MDQPSNDGVNSYFVTRCAKRDGIKAVLSGLGADEIFGGYVSFERIKWMRRFRQLPFKKTIARVLSSIKKSWARLVYLNIPGAIGDYLFLRGIYTPSEIARLLKFQRIRFGRCCALFLLIFLQKRMTSDMPPYWRRRFI